MDLILILVVALAGLLPPFTVFYLERRLAKSTLKKAEEIRDEAVNGANAIKAEMRAEIASLKGDIATLEMRVKGERLLTEDAIKDQISTLTSRVDERISTFEKKLNSIDINPTAKEAFLDAIGQRVARAFDGKLGAETKALINDPDVQEVWSAAIDNPQEFAMDKLRNTLQQKIINKGTEKLLSFLD